MANRKLQGEIDRVFKKVEDGVLVFEQIWDKVYSATTTAQKEKYEGDLKKEIKKLQRLRDHIKTWQGDSSIKDKSKLDSFRKLIEVKMERFKVCEKETKTKAFSKEGLAQDRTDPKQKAKANVGDWVRESISKLTEQCEELEAENETLNSGKRKRRNDEHPHVTQNKEHIKRHQHHMEMLERVLRAVDNDAVTPEEAEQLKEDVDYYIESNQDADFVEYDEMYDTLNLDAAPTPVAAATATTPTTAAAATTPPPPSAPANSSAKKSKTSATGSNNGTNATASAVPSPTSAPTTPVPSVPTADEIEEQLSATTPSKKSPSSPRLVAKSGKGGGGIGSGKDGKSGSSGAVLASNRNNSSPKNSSRRGNGGSNGHSSLNSNSNGTSSSSSSSGDQTTVQISPRSPRNQGNRLNASADGITNTDAHSPLLSNVVRTTSAGTGGPVKGGTVGNAIGGVGNGHAITTTSLVSDLSAMSASASSKRTGAKTQTQTQAQTQTSGNFGSVATLPSTANGGVGGASGLNNATTGAPGFGGVMTSNGILGTINGGKSGSNVYDSSSGRGTESITNGSGDLPRTIPTTSVHLNHPQQQASLHQLQAHPQQHPSQQQLRQNPSNAPSIRNKNGDRELDISSDKTNVKGGVPTGTGALSGGGVGSVLSQIDKDLLILEGMLKYMPEARHPPGVHPHPQQQQPGGKNNGGGAMSMNKSSSGAGGPLSPIGVSASMSNNPQQQQPTSGNATTTSSTSATTPRNPMEVPTSFPSVPATVFDSREVFHQFDLDTLFFIFYYQQGTYQQYLAASELKRQGWRFHKKYQTWFQRHDEPKISTDEYETGTFIYFDYANVVVRGQGSGWCRRFKSEFRFEYRFLEDEL